MELSFLFSVPFPFYFHLWKRGWLFKYPTNSNTLLIQYGGCIFHLNLQSQIIDRRFLTTGKTGQNWKLYLHLHNYKYCHTKTMKWFHLFWQQIHRSYWIARLAENRVRAITGVQAKDEYTFLNRSPNFSVLPTTACTKQVRVIVATKTCRKCYHLIVNHALVGHYWMKPMTENTHENEACVTKLYISVTIKGVRTRVSEFTGVVAWSVEKNFPWLSERCDVQASF